MNRTANARRGICTLLALLLILTSLPGLALEKGEFPLTTEPVTLKIWGGEIVNLDQDNCVANIEYQKMTGVTIEWDLFSSSMNFNEAFNIMIVSNDLPDIISGTHTPERIMMCVEGNIPVRLNEYIESGSYYLDALTEQPQYWDMVTATDGGVYTLIYTDSGVHKDSEYKMYVYTEWLEKLNLANPTTPEEFKEMLIALSTNDLNENGKNDELPMVGYYNGRQTNPLNFLMNPFELYRDNYYYISDGGEIVFVANTDGWREGLKYICDLYASGLIMEETYVQDQTQFQSLLNRPKGETIMGVFPAWYQGAFIDINILDWTDYQAIPPLMGPTGLQQTAARKGGNFNLSNIITTACENPEIAFRFLDWFLSHDGNRFTQFGAEGITYELVDAPAFNGATPSISMKFFETPQVWNSGTMPRYDTAAVRYSTTANPEKRNVENTYVLFSAAEIYEPYYVWHNVPDVVWCADQDLLTQRNDYLTVFNEYIGSCSTAFVMGTMDINDDAQWESYKGALESMGLADYLATLAAYHGIS